MTLLEPGGLRFPLRYLTRVALAGVVSTACSEVAAPPGDAADPAVHLVGVVQDSVGSAWPEAAVQAFVFPAPRGQVRANGADDNMFWGRTDQTGHYAIALGQIDQAQIDSVFMTVYTGGCADVATQLARYDLPIRVGLADTVRVNVTTINQFPTVPRLMPQVLCGIGSLEVRKDVSRLGGTFWFSLSIEDVSDSIRGRYDVTYAASYGDDIGYFSGVREANALVLNLRPTQARDMCPIGPVLRIALTSDGGLGKAQWAPTTCWQPTSFTFDVTHQFWFNGWERR
jgi:hypothetical protein